MQSRKRACLVVLTASATLGALATPAGASQDRQVARQELPAPTDAVTTWNAIAGKAALDACLSPGNDPLHESRMYAMTHIAIHDALNAIEEHFEPYAFEAQRPVTGASAEAAVASAARGVLVPLIEEGNAAFEDCKAAAVEGVEDAYTDALADIDDGSAKTKGVHLGVAAAAAILALRTGDGSDTELFDRTTPADAAPGVYRLTPPFDFQFAPDWADVTPFALRASDQFRPGPPHELTSSDYAADVNEVKAVGSATSTTRTEDQTEIARFWYESSPLAWNRIARTVSAMTPGLTLWDNARLFGLLNIAMADGYIANWDSKRHYNRWRPITAIREAASDGNPDTSPDPEWAPLLDTPPVPAYASGHSVQGAAAAEVLTQFFGTDDKSFMACSFTLPAGDTCTDPGAIFRSFTSFSQAAEENGESRILVGIHFRHDVEEGLAQGRAIGDRVVDKVLELDH
jgi:hypothetical protein